MDWQLETIAEATRTEMESFARENRGVSWDNDASRNMDCFCAIASYFLVMVGRKFGYNLTLVQGIAFDDTLDMEDDKDFLIDQINHCWVEYKGEIIDLTARQFKSSLQRVHIVNVDNNEYWPIHRNNVVRKDFKTDWPEEQSPYTHINELRKRAKKLIIKIAA